MQIPRPDWEKVQAAYEVGRKMERDYGRTLRGHEPPLNEDAMRRDLKRLSKCLKQCSEETLVLIDIQIAWHRGRLEPLQPILSEGLLQRYLLDAEEQLMKPNEGRPAPWRYRMAVAALRDIWSDKKNRGRDNPYYNEMVRWMGEQLQRLDPKLDTEAARQAAYQALAPR